MRRFSLIIGIAIVGCGARSELWEPEIEAQPQACIGPSDPPPCAACRLATCADHASACDDDCIAIEVCAESNCYGLDLDGWEPDSPLNACLRSCASEFGPEPFKAFLAYVGCARFDAACASSACTGSDDYELCRGSLGTCSVGAAEVARRCMLVWWLEGADEDGWHI